MKVFITRVWGFGPERWPVITFGLEGNRDSLLQDSLPGDRIVFVGTLREPTPEPLRGRLLGMAEIGRIAVDTLDVIGDDFRGPNDYDEAGHFRWPKAILMVRAWRFMPQPMLLDVLAEQLPYHATSQAVLLQGGDADAIMSLNAEEVEIPASEALVKARLLDKALNSGRPTTGPEPKSWEGSTGRDVNRTAFTYAFRFGRTDIWKIGHAVDVKERLKQVNCHIPPEAVPERWNAKFQQAWDSETDAYAMEQRVLQTLAAGRTDGERVRCTEAELWTAWLGGIGA
ncbi:hypothetical protein [Nitratireductor sp. ZSWI3]|uniref:hypothetical protein n=1 Tax=Nitratireductor sp. ZSWI3 TaxID=2966359 RepID=UPI00214FB714|nr:hypothetical protein [Nitratireductor sp. ZSWI3]MCR4268435.1 hypothetical protein [Nitratireductor sp. ZSWI3]